MHGDEMQSYNPIESANHASVYKCPKRTYEVSMSTIVLEQTCFDTETNEHIQNMLEPGKGIVMSDIAVDTPDFRIYPMKIPQSILRVWLRVAERNITGIF